MDDARTKVRRLIELQVHLRASGVSPDIKSIESVITFAVGSGLLSDEVVRSYLVEAAKTCSRSYLVAKALLDTILPLVAAEHAEDGLAIFNQVFRVKTPDEWYASGQFGSNHLLLTALNSILGQDCLLLDHPETWGVEAVSLFDQFLHAYQRKFRSDSRESRVSLEGYSAEKADSPDGITVVHDDPLAASYLYFKHEWQRTEPHRVVATILEKALGTAAAFDTAEKFTRLTDRLVAIKWSLAIGLPLRILYNQITASTHRDWHVLEAVRLLSRSSVAGVVSISTSRCLLLSSLADLLDGAQRKAILSAMRSSAPSKGIRVGELWEVRSWPELTQDEVTRIKKAEEADEILPLRDPRTPSDLAAGFQYTSANEDHSFANDWPIPEQRSLITRLHTMENKKDLGLEELKRELPPRLEALMSLLSKDAAGEPAWRCSFLEWGGTILGEMKRLALLRSGKDPMKDSLSLAEYLDELSSKFSSWPMLAEWALEDLEAAPPESHGRHAPGVLAWSPGDPMFASIKLLDELLAIEAGEPFDSLRARFGDIFAKVWVKWPTYTKSVSLILLRLYHLGQIPQLQKLLEAAVVAETDSAILLRAMSVLLGTRKVADHLRLLMARLPKLSGAADLANQLGVVLGSSILQARKDSETKPILVQVAALCDEALSTHESLGPYGIQFVRAVIWGAAELLGTYESVPERLAGHWEALAKRAIESAMLSSTDEDGRLERLLHGVMLGLESRWSPATRTRLYDALAPTLENVIRKGSLGDVSWLHYLLMRELNGAEEDQPIREKLPLAPTDSVLIGFCRASAERVREWRNQKMTTNDIGWVSMLSGEDTAAMIRKVYRVGSDKAYVQRSLAPVIDVLSEAGIAEVAADLRLMLRRGKTPA